MSFPIRLYRLLVDLFNLCNINLYIIHFLLSVCDISNIRILSYLHTKCNDGKMSEYDYIINIEMCDKYYTANSTNMILCEE